MLFHEWLLSTESSLNDLYASTVAAFPSTTKRQHAIDPVRIVELDWTPFVGVGTLFVKGRAQNTESGKEYRSMVLFKDVAYHDATTQDGVGIIASDGRPYRFEKLNYAENDVLVRCDCPDFFWRFNFFNKEDGSLYGRVRRRYEAHVNPGSANPGEMPGMCKHLIKLVQSLSHAGILEE